MSACELIDCPDWITVKEASVAPGGAYWRLKKVEYWDDQASGGTHHIYTKAPHDPAARMVISNGQEEWSLALDKPTSEPSANFAMWGHNRYSAAMEGLPSDRVEGLHMPSNFHVSYLLWWERAVKEDEGDPGNEPPPPDSTLRDALLTEGEARQLLRFNPTAAIQKVIFREGFVPNSAEFELTHEGNRYIAQRAERLSDGAVRVFYVLQGDWNNVRWEAR